MSDMCWCVILSKNVENNYLKMIQIAFYRLTIVSTYEAIVVEKSEN